MRRTKPLRRRTRLRPRNAKRLKRLRDVQFGPQAALCRTLRCCICNAPPPSDPHHVKSRGAGGTDADYVALCRRCHDGLHRHGERWLTVYYSGPQIWPDTALAKVRALLGADANDLPVAMSLGSNPAWR